MTPLWKQKQDSVRECVRLAVAAYRLMRAGAREEFVHGLATHLADQLPAHSRRDWQYRLAMQVGKEERNARRRLRKEHARADANRKQIDKSR